MMKRVALFNVLVWDAPLPEFSFDKDRRNGSDRRYREIYKENRASRGKGFVTSLVDKKN